MATQPQTLLPTAPPTPDEIHTFSWDRPGDPSKVPEGFGLGHEADATYLDDVLTQTKTVLDQLYDEADESVLQPDLVVAHFRGSVRPQLTNVLAELDAKAQKHFSDPNRQWLSQVGREHVDREFDRERTQQLIAVEEQLVGRLDELEADAAEALAAANGLAVTAHHDDVALKLAAMLSHVTIAHGLPMVASFIRDASHEPALAYAALPFFRSMFDRPGTEWTRNVELLRAVRACEAIVEANAEVQARPVRAKLERVERARWELSQMLAAARDRDPKARSTAWNAVDGDGRLVLFPDPPVEAPDIPNLLTTLPPGQFRRVATGKISAAQREKDRRARLAQE